MTVELVKFWAPWCGSCRLFAPVVDRLVQSKLPKITLRNVNLAESPDEAESLSVSTLPTLIFLVDGVEADRVVGTVPYHQLSDIADRVTGASTLAP